MQGANFFDSLDILSICWDTFSVPECPAVLNTSIALDLEGQILTVTNFYTCTKLHVPLFALQRIPGQLGNVSTCRGPPSKEPQTTKLKALHGRPPTRSFCSSVFSTTVVCSSWALVVQDLRYYDHTQSGMNWVQSQPGGLFVRSYSSESPVLDLFLETVSFKPSHTAFR